jgi:TonB-linked SusC/RagA family outer membrane protein
MKKILLLSLLLVAGMFQRALSQDRTVTGKVTSFEDGAALPGVNVQIKGTNSGTATGSDGSYSINVPSEGTLVFSFIGLTTQQIAIGNQTVINVKLASDLKQLSELVVVGYGVQDKKDITGSITQVKGNIIANLATPSFDSQLAGRAAGVQVITPSGLLGSAPQIRIRGTNSISSGTSPLIVIDGVPSFSGSAGGTFGTGFSPTNPLADINPTDIESFEVLKDGAATAIYGSRASNGVILITTKRGKKGKAKFTYDSYVGMAKASKLFDLLGAEDFVTINNEKLTNAPGGVAQAKLMTDANGNTVDTDWQKEVFRTGIQQSHSLSASGGTDKTNYYFSLGYSKQNGIARSNELERFSMRANIDQKITDHISFGFSTGITRQATSSPLSGSNNLSGNTFAVTRMLPNVPAFNEGDVTGYNIDAIDRKALGRGANGITISDGIANIRFVLDNNKREAQSLRILSNAFLEFNLFKGLKFKSQLGVDYTHLDDYYYQDPRSGDGFGSTGAMGQYSSNQPRWNWQNIVTYSNTIAQNHNFDLTLVAEAQKTRQSYFGARVANLSDRLYTENIISQQFVSTTAAVDGDVTRNAIDSYLGRLNYNYKRKYYIGASIRRDRLSSIPKDQRVGNFPGVSFAWRISQEPFFAPLTKIVSDLKLRGSFAKVGNTSLSSDFPSNSIYGAASYGTQSGIALTQAGNTALRWESQKIYDAGIDAAFLEDRFTLSFAYWRKDNDDIILAVPQPPSVGVPNNTINQNIGFIKNSGIELTLGGEILKKGDFSWNASFNLTTQKNEVLTLYKGQDIFTSDGYNIIREGESMRSLYGYRNAGVNAANGNPLYYKTDNTLVQGDISSQNYYTYDPANPKDVSAAKLSSLSSNDRAVLGNVIPTYFGGFDNNFTFKNFDLNIFLRYQGGNKILNRTRTDLLNMNFVNNGKEILGRWQSEGQPGDGVTPRLYTSRSTFINNDASTSSRFVESGNFLRISNITLGYTIPKTILTKIGIDRLRVYGQVQNVAVFTKYKGLDPETNTANTAGTTGVGVDYNGNPQQRVFLLGLNLNF